jgi:cytochrome P450
MFKMNIDPEGAMAAGSALRDDFVAVIEDRRANGMRDDIISALLVGQLDGKPLPDDQVIAYLFTLDGGGIFTTTAALGNALIRMHHNHALRDTLLARPALIPNAVEEFLRIDAPVQAVARTLSHDVELNGCPMKAGDRALLVWAAANHDPNVFEDPELVKFERDPNHHMAFGMGLHRCIGSHLARSMFRIMLETVLSRTPDFELTGDPEEHRYDDPGMIYGLHHLTARFTPAARKDS